MEERLRLLRKVLNLTQQKFADRLGVKRNTIANYETGRNVPIGSVFSLICKEFNVNEEWLRYGTGNMFIKKTTFSLDEYAKSNHLTSKEVAIVRGFMELSPDIRNAIYDIFKNAFSGDGAYDSAPDNPEELEKVFPPVDDADSNIG